MLDSKFIGGLLLVVGTSIGGGMLALPVVTAAAGITVSVLFLFLCWLIMTAGALLILEVNLRLPAGSNMISMARSTLGIPGQIIAWITYLMLLYTLLAGYISGGSDVFSGLLHTMHMDLPNGLVSTLFTLLFGIIIYHGIKAVDFVNRGLMFGKLGVYALLVLIIAPHVHNLSWHEGSLSAITGSLMILVSSFGFASIVPSLREYFQDDVPALRKIILFGSLIPLCCYIAWEIIIMGTIQKEGTNGLLTLFHSAHATSGLTNALSFAVQNQWITGFFSFFTSICMITAFLGVSLGLFDFLADGLKLNKFGKQGKMTLALTFIPPLIVVLFIPGIYIQALSYAGVCCVVLLLLLPTAMAWKGRKAFASSTILLPGGNVALMTIGFSALILLGIAWHFG